MATAREKLHARESTRLYARLGVQEWRAYPGIAAGLAGWLAGTETVRRTCGGGVGLLGSVFGRDGSGTEGSIVGAAADAAVDAATIVVDPSLSTGGLLWFPDLLSPDPLHVLPLAFSALLLLNAWPRDAETLRRVFAVGSSSSVGAGAASPSASLLARLALRRTLLLLAIAAGPVTMHLPAAMHVFWVGSAGWAYLQNRIVEWVFPAKADKADEMLKRGTENGGPTDRWYVRPPLPEDEPARKV